MNHRCLQIRDNIWDFVTAFLQALSCQFPQATCIVAVCVGMQGHISNAVGLHGCVLFHQVGYVN